MSDILDLGYSMSYKKNPRYKLYCQDHVNISAAILQHTDICSYMESMRPKTRLNLYQSSFPRIISHIDTIINYMNDQAPIVPLSYRVGSDTHPYYTLHRLHENYCQKIFVYNENHALNKQLSSQWGVDIWKGFQKDFEGVFSDFKLAWSGGWESLVKLALTYKWLSENHSPFTYTVQLDRLFESVLFAYDDVLSHKFLELSPQAHFMDQIFSHFKRTLTRCSLTTICAENDREPLSQFLWHRDESPFLSTRVLIPITTFPEFVYEISDSDKFEGRVYNLAVGNMYTWDTSKLHRMFNFRPSRNKRISLLLGVSPWFDYIQEEDAWVSNDFYGRKHPFDMFMDGDFYG